MGVLVLLTFGGGWGEEGVVQNRESPDFRSPEVGRYVLWHGHILCMEKDGPTNVLLCTNS